MATIKGIRAFAPDDIDTIAFNAPTVEAIESVGMGAFKKAIFGHGPAFTGVIDGKPVCIAGVSHMWNGVGEAWALMAEGFENHKFFIHRSIIRGLNEIIIMNNLNRVQAAAACNNRKAVMWLERLGFENEGVMRKYFNGKDYYRFARVV